MLKTISIDEKQSEPDFKYSYKFMEIMKLSYQGKNNKNMNRTEQTPEIDKNKHSQLIFDKKVRTSNSTKKRYFLK